MKQLFKVLSIGLAATALFSCNKEIDNQIPESSGGVRKVEFVAGPVTRTVFGTPSGTTLPTLWTTNKNVSISLNFATALTSSTPIVSNDGANASFSVDIEDGEGVIAPYLFYAVSPSTALISMNSTHKSALVDISASQTPLENSVDEGAQVLVAKYNAGNSFPTSSITMDFAHLTAYGKISFSHLTLADGETVASVSLTAAENWAGRYYYYFEDNGTNEAGDLEANSASKTITLTTNKTSDIWFACAPVDLGGKKVNVVITTNAGTTYSKEITIPTGKTFASGKVNSFTVNMSGISPDGAVEYELVTNPSDLTIGSKIIIAATGETLEAMSTTQNNNNRSVASVTKSNNNTVITSPSDAVQILTVTAGNKDNTIGFFTGEGYLYAASSESNWLRTEETLTDESSWVVTISSEGVATVIAQGENTRNILRYNGSNNPHIFSCYSSTSSVQSLVSIYKLADNTVWNLSSIAVTTAPDKTAYVAGEDFDSTGMVVTATYVDANDSQHTKTVVLNNADLTISPSSNLETGTTSVNISYGGKSTTQAITVTAPIIWDLKSIAVTTAPAKTIYQVGEFFDPTGMVVTATYENHDNTTQTKDETVAIADLTFSPTTSTALTINDVTITITYNGKSTTQAITVTAATDYYELVTSTVSGGKYLIVFNDNKAHATKDGKDLAATTGVLTITSDNKIKKTAELASSLTAAEVTISSSGSILLPSGSYLAVANNACAESNTATAFTYTYNSTQGGMVIKGSTGGYNDRILYNNNNVYRFYADKTISSGALTSGYSLPNLYKLVEAGGTITVATPTFSVASGTYSSTQSVQIQCETDGATIYYTTDNSTPDDTKTVYTGAITISTTTTVKAIAIKDGVSSGVASATYTISSGSVTKSMTSFSAVSGYVDGDSNVSYAATQGSATTAPVISDGVIRIYQNGGLLTITANNQKKIIGVTIGSAMDTEVAVSVDGGTYSSNHEVNADGTYTESNLNASTVVFKCTGSDKSHRLYLNLLSVTYN